MKPRDDDSVGAFDGQIEGFDVVFNQQDPVTLADGEVITLKTWAAPELGCFVLKLERIAMHEGQLMYDETRLYSNVRLGEPDPWYFADEPTFTARTHAEWQDLYVTAR